MSGIALTVTEAAPGAREIGGVASAVVECRRGGLQPATLSARSAQGSHSGRRQRRSGRMLKRLPPWSHDKVTRLENTRCAEVNP